MSHHNITMALTAVCVVHFGMTSHALQFRGLDVYQQNNNLSSPALGRTWDYGIDIRDDFNRVGPLGNSVVDSFRIGFVPPWEGVPNGPLTGAAQNLHGRWMPETNAEYIAMNGAIGRQTGQGESVVCLPWRVPIGLGDDYLIEMTTIVAEGEKVRLAYFGDVQRFGSSQGLDGRLGQLVFSIERGSDTDTNPATGSQDLAWTVHWDEAGVLRRVFGSTTAPVGEELKMQLGWKDLRTMGSSDQFDALLTTSGGTVQLAAGDLNHPALPPIEVFGVGFEIEGVSAAGTISRITSFTSAVPEPSGTLVAMLGIGLGLIGIRKRRDWFLS